MCFFPLYAEFYLTVFKHFFTIHLSSLKKKYTKPLRKCYVLDFCHLHNKLMRKTSDTIQKLRKLLLALYKSLQKKTTKRI